MIVELRLKNFGLCVDAKAIFGKNLNVVTGETGAGKSTLAEALSVLAGSRASAILVRQGEKQAELDLLISSGELRDKGKEIGQILEELGISPEEDDLLFIKRIIYADGKSRSYINGSLVPLSALKNLGAALFDLHGQYEHQRLLNPGKQLNQLDACLGKDGENSLKTYENLYYLLKEAVQKLEKNKEEKHEREKKAEFLRFQLGELEKGDIKPGEIEKLRDQDRFLRGIEKLRESASIVDGSLHGGEMPGIFEYIRGMNRALAGAVEYDRERIGAILENIASIDALLEAVDDISRQLARAVEEIDIDIDQVNRRLIQYNDLFRKYNCNDENELLKRVDDIKMELDGLEKKWEEEQDLPAKIAQLEKKALASALEISAIRNKRASQLSKQVSAYLKRLGAPHGDFMIKVEDQIKSGGITVKNGEKSVILGPKGQDSVEYLVSMNKGLKPRPLAEIASGGEVSRIMLSLKASLGEDDTGAPISVFDEIDSGIGGETAQGVADILREIGKDKQVISITHLPVIASVGNHHIIAEKSADSQQAQIIIRKVEGEDRIREIARMLGDSKRKSALIMAKELLARASEE